MEPPSKIAKKKKASKINKTQEDSKDITRDAKSH